MVGNGMGAKNGILFKTAVSLEEAGKVQIVALDKTGTITSGQPEVTDLLPADGISEQELLTMAFALEKKSEHPLAKAILGHAESLHLTAPEVTDFHALPGNGLSAMLMTVFLAAKQVIQRQPEIHSLLLLIAEICTLSPSSCSPSMVHTPIPNPSWITDLTIFPELL